MIDDKSHVGVVVDQGSTRVQLAPAQYVDREVVPNGSAQDPRARRVNSSQVGGPNGIRTRVYGPPRACCYELRTSRMLTQLGASGDLNSEGSNLRFGFEATLRRRFATRRRPVHERSFFFTSNFSLLMSPRA